MMRKSSKPSGRDGNDDVYKPCKSYSFLARTVCASSKLAIDALCVFFNESDSVLRGFCDELKDALNSHDVLPDCVVIIADKKEGWDDFLGQWRDNAVDVKDFRQRGWRENTPYIKCYYFVMASIVAGRGAKPELKFIVKLKKERGQHDFKLDMKDIAKKGIENLINTNPVVQVAPSGHVFRNPSGSKSKVFIKASELAMTETEIAFVGWCLSHELLKLEDGRDLKVVYIDTMGIYPIVRYALNALGSDARIHSYHSYSYFHKITPPAEPYAVVISASTSGTMAKKICNENGFDSKKICTLVDLSRNDRVGSVMAALDEFKLPYAKLLRDESGENETQIELSGEHFSSKSKPPRAVVLSAISHNPKNLREFLKQFGKNGLLDFDDKSAPGSARMVRLDGGEVGGNKSLSAWLDDEISWCVASAIDYIVHADDAGSVKLAEKVARKIKKNKGGAASQVISVAHKELNENILKKAGGVLVVQAVAGDGGVLRRISRDLREFFPNTKPCHFLIGVGLPQDQGRWDRLQQFIVRNAGDRKYGFSVWMKLLVGTDDAGNLWGDLCALFSGGQVQKENDAEQKDGAKPNNDHENGRRDILKESRDISDNLRKRNSRSFVSMRGSGKLKLSSGFLFFGDVFGKDWNKVPDSTIYATIAAVLQSARDCDNLGSKLKATDYESVVLDPENFLRFNDGILQACILRAARKSELDYSSSPDLSRHMKEILMKIFERHEHVYGEAAIEFAAALASHKMKLADNDMSEVKEKAKELMLKSSEPNALWGLIDMA